MKGKFLIYEKQAQVLFETTFYFLTAFYVSNQGVFDQINCDKKQQEDEEKTNQKLTNDVLHLKSNKKLKKIFQFNFFIPQIFLLQHENELIHLNLLVSNILF